jgi:hypothetical protein
MNMSHTSICKHAFYSEEQSVYGTSFYRDETDTEFEVTEVGDSPYSSSLRSDLVKLPTVGILTYVREGKPHVLTLKEMQLIERDSANFQLD